MDRKKLLSLINSISTKITLLIFGIALLAVVTNVTKAESASEQAILDVNEDYILTMAKTTADLLESSTGGSTDPATYTAILGNSHMEGIDSSYTYLVAEDGTMIYHPTSDKIGKPVENSVVLDVVAQLQSGALPESNVAIYDFNGEKNMLPMQ